MANVERRRTMRSVTLDDSLVGRLKKLGPKLMPPETNFSRLLDRAMAEMIQRHEETKPARKAQR